MERESATPPTSPSNSYPEGQTGLVSATALNLVIQRMVPILSAMLPPGIASQMRLVPDLGPQAIEPVQVVRIVSNLVLNSCAALGRKANSTPNATVTIETANDSTGWGSPAGARYGNRC